MNKIISGVIAAAFLGVFPVSAQEYVWSGAGNAGKWTDPPNWGRVSGYPGAGDTAVFNDDVTITEDFEIGEGTLYVTNAASKALHFRCSISGAGGISKGGDGSIHLHRANTFTGKFSATGTKDGSSSSAQSSLVWVYANGALGQTEANFDQDVTYGHGVTLYFSGEDGTTDFVVDIPVKPSGCQKYSTSNSGIQARNGVRSVTFKKDVTSRFRTVLGYDSASAGVAFYFEGECKNNNYAHSSGSNMSVHFKGCCKLSTVYFDCPIYLYPVADGHKYLNYYPRSNGRTYLMGENALASGGNYDGGFSRMELNGYDQTLTSTGAKQFYIASGETINSAEKATLTLGGTSAATLFRGGFTGLASFNWCPTTTTRTFTFTNKVSTTGGDFSTSARILFARDSGFSHLGKLDISATGEVELSAEARKDNYATNIVIAAGGKLNIGRGITVRAMSAVYGEGEPLAAGRYHAGDTGCDFLEGEGTFEVFPYAYIENSWTGGKGDWTDDSRWSAGRAPEAHDFVTISGSNVEITNRTATAEVEMLTVGGGAKLLFAAWDAPVQAVRAICLENSTVTALGPFTNDTAKTRVYFKTQNFTMTSEAKISLNGLGWRGGYIVPDGSVNPSLGNGAYNSRNVKGGGHGPGGSDWQYAGATHFGLGGYCTDKQNGARDGRYYDNPAAPLEPGSGGYRISTSAYGQATSSGAIGSGGGAVFIDATGAVTIDGEISANGVGSTAHYHYNTLGNTGYGNTGGSGGSVYIRSATFGGTGTITANGGTGTGGVSYMDNPTLGTKTDGCCGAGGGGGIAVYVDLEKQTAGAASGLTLSAAGGLYVAGHGNSSDKSQITCGEDLTYANVDKSNRNAEPGTLYFNDTRLIDDMIGKGLYGRLAGVSEYTYDGDLEWTAGYVRFGETGVVFNVTGNLTMEGDNSRLDIGGNHMVTHGVGHRQWLDAGNQPVRLTVGGNLSVGYGAALYVFAAKVVGEENWGAEVAVTGEFKVDYLGNVYPTSCFGYGGAPRFTSGSFTLVEGGKVDGKARGCSGSSNFAGVSWAEPAGVGKGRARYAASAGYGGEGAFGYKNGVVYDSGASKGAVVGDAYRPIYSGSGGGSSGYGPGGDGGGIFHLVASGSVVVNGLIDMDGGAAEHWDSRWNMCVGAGSGGAICIFGSTVAAANTAVLTARGGCAYILSTTLQPATGGGGRISILTGDGYGPSGVRTVSSTDSGDAALGGAFANWAASCSAAGGAHIDLTAAGSESIAGALGAEGTVYFSSTAHLPGLMMLVR